MDIIWSDGTVEITIGTEKFTGHLGHMTIQCEYELIDGVARNLRAYNPTIADLLEDFKSRIERDELPQ